MSGRTIIFISNAGNQVLHRMIENARLGYRTIMQQKHPQAEEEERAREKFTVPA